jgi:hypothetical protein
MNVLCSLPVNLKDEGGGSPGSGDGGGSRVLVSASVVAEQLHRQASVPKSRRNTAMIWTMTIELLAST